MTEQIDTNIFDPLKLTTTKLEIKGPFEQPTIHGVYVRKLQTNVDGRGDLTEFWSKFWTDSNMLKPIGHAYYNITDPGVMKGWHWHERSSSQYVCLAGKMQIVLIDLRADSESFGHVNQFIASSKNPLYIQIPPYVLKGWKALEQNGLILNLIDTDDVKDNKKVPPNSFLNDIWQPING